MRSSYWNPEIARERDRERERVERERDQERWRRQLASDAQLETVFIFAMVIQSLVAVIAIGWILASS